MMKDKRFKSDSAKVDHRGREKVKEKGNAEMKRFYQEEEEDEIKKPDFLDEEGKFKWDAESSEGSESEESELASEELKDDNADEEEDLWDSEHEDIEMGNESGKRFSV